MKKSIGIIHALPLCSSSNPFASSKGNGSRIVSYPIPSLSIPEPLCMVSAKEYWYIIISQALLVRSSLSHFVSCGGNDGYIASYPLPRRSSPNPVVWCPHGGGAGASLEPSMELPRRAMEWRSIGAQSFVGLGATASAMRLPRLLSGHFGYGHVGAPLRSWSRGLVEGEGRLGVRDSGTVRGKGAGGVVLDVLVSTGIDGILVWSGSSS